MPHTHINPAEAFEQDEGYSAGPSPRARPGTCCGRGASSATAAATSAGWTRPRRCAWTASTRPPRPRLATGRPPKRPSRGLGRGEQWLDIEAFTQGQMAEAEAEGFASAAEAAASGAEAGAAAETGIGGAAALPNAPAAATAGGHQDRLGQRLGAGPSPRPGCAHGRPGSPCRPAPSGSPAAAKA